MALWLSKVTELSHWYSLSWYVPVHILASNLVNDGQPASLSCQCIVCFNSDAKPGSTSKVSRTRLLDSTHEDSFRNCLHVLKLSSTLESGFPIFTHKHPVFTHAHKLSYFSALYCSVFNHKCPCNKEVSPWPLVHKRTIPTERLPLVGEV
jgi:hypothetical protein